MESLNPDVFGEIVEYLSVNDVTSLANASKHCRAVSWPAVKRITMEFNKGPLNYILSRTLTSINHITLEYPPNIFDDLNIVSEVHPLTNLTTLKSVVLGIGKTITTVELFRICTYLTQLESIVCQGIIEGTDVAVFSRHTNLTTFTWGVDSSITNNWYGLARLRKLDLSGNFLYHHTRCDIRMLTSLTSLNISYASLLPEDEDQITCLTNLQDLRSALNCPKPEILRKLPNISSLGVSEVQDPNIGAISTQLTKLIFEVDVGGTRFPKSSLLTNLKHLFIEEDTDNPQPANFYFTDLKQLQKVQIKAPILLRAISAANLTNLRELDVRRPRSLQHIISEEDIIAMCNITSLEKLVVSAYNLDTKIFYQNVKKLSNLRSLTILDYNYEAPLGPEDITCLQPLTLLTYLQIPALTAATGKEITKLTQLIELEVKLISGSLTEAIKSFPFRVVYADATDVYTNAKC